MSDSRASGGAARASGTAFSKRPPVRSEPRAGGGVNRHACRSAQQPHDLSKKDLREGADGLGAVGEEAAQTGERRRPPAEMVWGGENDQDRDTTGIEGVEKAAAIPVGEPRMASRRSVR